MVIEHSLRIRANASSNPVATTPARAARPELVASADNVAVAMLDDQAKPIDIPEGTALSQVSTVVVSNSSTVSTTSDQSTPPTASTPLSNEPIPQKSGKNSLVGRVNNLVTTDLENISSATTRIFWICGYSESDHTPFFNDSL